MDAWKLRRDGTQQLGELLRVDDVFVEMNCFFEAQLPQLEILHLTVKFLTFAFATLPIAVINPRIGSSLNWFIYFRNGTLYDTVNVGDHVTAFRHDTESEKLLDNFLVRLSQHDTDLCRRSRH